MPLKRNVLFTIVTVSSIFLFSQNFERVPGLNRIVELPLGLKASQLALPTGETLDPSMVELGNLLFFDARLSANRAMSCATCHDPAKGYSASAFSLGIDGNPRPRTTQMAMNRAFGSRNDWTGAKTLEQQSTAPITTVTEMGLTRAQLLATVTAVPGYVDRFKRLVTSGLLKGPAISVGNIQLVIATFQRSLMTGTSPVDFYEAGDTTALSATEISGRNLFLGKARCVLCHAPPLYADEGFHNIVSGCLPGAACVHPTPTFEAGRFLVSADAADLGKFKTPSLRNVGLRGPYFHNGVDATLEIVVRGYNLGSELQTLIGQDPLLINLNLTTAEETQLVAFLNALTGDLPKDPWLSQAGTNTSPARRESIYLSPDIYSDSIYQSTYPDLAGLTVSELRSHWLATGMNEGRRANDIFDVSEYVILNPAVNSVLKSAEGTTTYYKLAINQYLDSGRRDGLPGRYAFAPGFFNVNDYRGYNPDAKNMMYPEAIRHYASTELPKNLLTHLNPNGYFFVSTSNYYANGKGYCKFASRAELNTSNGRTDGVGVVRRIAIPSNLYDGGACITTVSPPKMTNPMPADKILAFSCSTDNNTAGCTGQKKCPAGMEIKAIRAACNLEFTTPPTPSFFSALAWNSVAVEVAAGIFDYPGHCRVENVDLVKGNSAIVVPAQSLNRTAFGCQATELGRGDCYISGQLRCGY